MFRAREELIARLDSSAADMQTSLERLQAVEEERDRAEAEIESFRHKVTHVGLGSCPVIRHFKDEHCVCLFLFSVLVQFGTQE